MIQASESRPKRTVPRRDIMKGTAASPITSGALWATRFSTELRARALPPKSWSSFALETYLIIEAGMPTVSTDIGPALEGTTPAPLEGTLSWPALYQAVISALTPANSFIYGFTPNRLLNVFYVL